jgi:Zn-dependent protease
MSAPAIIVLVALNLGIIFLLIAAPLGQRTVTVRRVVAADAEKLWSALWPLGSQAGWSGEVVWTRPVAGATDEALQGLSWEGRDGAPMERRVSMEAVEPFRCFTLRVVDDTALEMSFWKDYVETVALVPAPGGVAVTLTRTDRYSGIAFLLFRYFALRRQAKRLKNWAETGKATGGALFEHPVTQIGLAALSALLLWPLFGLNQTGLVLALALTVVVALHELGHLAAFRLMGHRRVRMIFIPLLGGIAIGGRPYDSRFEVAFVALMGAGFSAFLVPLAIAASEMADGAGWSRGALALAALAGCAALFNLANLVPVWKFDGGQVLRQIAPGPALRAAASFALLAAFLGLGWVIGLSLPLLFSGGVIFAILSLITTGNAVKPRHELKPIAPAERLAVAAALLSIFVIHGGGVLWAVERLL